MKTKLLAAALTLTLLAAGLLLKLTLFPSFKETDFALNERSLQQVSSGLVVVRPTRFAWSHFRGIVFTSVRPHGKPVPRFLGRNVSFTDLIATAYGQNAASVALPPDAPSTNFDFIVTVRANPEHHLQQAIRQSLGFVARREPHDAPVLAVKVDNPSLPGLAVSDPDARQNVRFVDANLCFTHFPLRALTGNLEQSLGTRVVDKTGLTNLYDFCVPWTPDVQRQLQNTDTARPVVDEILKHLGLALKPDTALVEMLVVKRAN